MQHGLSNKGTFFLWLSCSKETTPKKKGKASYQDLKP